MLSCSVLNLQKNASNYTVDMCWSKPAHVGQATELSELQPRHLHCTCLALIFSYSLLCQLLVSHETSLKEQYDNRQKKIFCRWLSYCSLSLVCFADSLYSDQSTMWLAVQAPGSLSCNGCAKLSIKVFQNMSCISHGSRQEHCSRTADCPHIIVQAFFATWVLLVPAPCVHMFALVCATVSILWSINVYEEYISPSIRESKTDFKQRIVLLLRSVCYVDSCSSSRNLVFQLHDSGCQLINQCCCSACCQVLDWCCGYKAFWCVT